MFVPSVCKWGALALVMAMAMPTPSFSQGKVPEAAVDPDTGFDLGLGIEGGRIASHSYNRFEIDKAGRDFGLQVFVRHAAGPGFWQLGLGEMSAVLEGNNRGHGFENQKLNLTMPYGEASYRFQLPLGFDLGLTLRTVLGKAASFAVGDTDKVIFNALGGPVLGYTWNIDDWRVGLTATYLQNADQSDRQVETLLVGVQLAYHFGAEPSRLAPSAAAPKQASQPKPMVEEDLVQIPVNLGEPVAYFAFGKSTLSPATERRLQRLAKALAHEGARLGPIKISGHTDSVGPKRINRPLSVARAEAVCAVFLNESLSPRQLTCAGYADDDPLPQYPTTAWQQRRAATLLLSVQPALAEEIRAIVKRTVSH